MSKRSNRRRREVLSAKEEAELMKEIEETQPFIDELEQKEHLAKVAEAIRGNEPTLAAQSDPGEVEEYNKEADLAQKRLAKERRLYDSIIRARKPDDEARKERDATLAELKEQEKLEAGKRNAEFQRQRAIRRAHIDSEKDRVPTMGQEPHPYDDQAEWSEANEAILGSYDPKHLVIEQLRACPEIGARPLCARSESLDDAIVESTPRKVAPKLHDINQRRR